jgi:hypothetical protein
MSDHIPEASKMVSDTPRTDAAYFRPHATMYDLAGEMKRMERELNAANSIIRQQQLLDEENLSLRQRIKRIESAIDRASNRFFADGSDGKVAAEMLTIMCGIADEEES